MNTAKIAQWAGYTGANSVLIPILRGIVFLLILGQAGVLLVRQTIPHAQAVKAGIASKTREDKAEEAKAAAAAAAAKEQAARAAECRRVAELQAIADEAERKAAKEHRELEMWVADRAPRIAAAAEIIKSAEERIADDRRSLATNTSLNQADKVFLLRRIATCEMRIADLRAYQQMRANPSATTAAVVSTIISNTENLQMVHNYYTDPFYPVTIWLMVRDIEAAKNGQ